MKSKKQMSDVPVGAECRVLSVLAEGGMRRRFLDIGLTPGACVKCIGKSPMGNPRAYLIRGKTVAIRNSDAAVIIVDSVFGGGYGTKKGLEKG